MTVMRSFFFLVILTSVVAWGVFSSGSTAYAGADAHAFEILYGEGVNAFNTKNYEKTVQVFDQAESQGNFDPRGYFFRGLAKSRLGLSDEAAKDFEYAASLELSKAGRSYNVPRALQRIQGKERLMIEQYRRAAKKKWENEQALQKKAEFEVQKQKDRLLYNRLIENGASDNTETGVAADPQPLTRRIPFGARAINPFGATGIKPTEIPSEAPVMTDDNMFKDELEKTVVLPPPARKNRTLHIPKEQRPGEKRRLAAERRARLEGREFGDEFGGGAWEDEGGLGPSPFGDDDDSDPFDGGNLFGEDEDNDPFEDGGDLFEGDDVDQPDDAFVDPFAETPTTEDNASDEVIPLPDTSTDESDSEESDSEEDPFALEENSTAAEQSEPTDDLEQEKQQIHDCFYNYKSAILSSNGTEAVQYLDQNTKDYYAQVLEWTLTAKRAGVESMSILDKMQVLIMRQRVPAEQLQNMTGEELLVYSIDNGMIGKNSVEKLEGGTITVDGDTGKMAALSNKQNTGISYEFSKENGHWKMDLTATFPVAKMAFESLVKSSGKSENAFIFDLLEVMTPQNPPTEDLWNPIGQ